MTLPEGLTKIESGAFLSCKSLQSVNLPESLTYIGPNAFWETALTQVTLPASLTFLGIGAYANCSSLTAIEAAGDGSNGFTSVDGVLFFMSKGMSSAALMQYPAGKADESYTIPSKITLNGKEESVSEIRKQAFRGCTALKNVTIPGSISKILMYAFYGCAALQTVTFQGSAPSIGDVAFGDDSLTVTYRDDGTWTDENMLNYGATSIIWAPVHVFKDHLCVGCGKEEEGYISSGTCGDSLNWYLYEDGILAINGTGAMDSSAFKDRDDFTKVNMAEGVTEIGMYAFQNTALTQVTLPASLTFMSRYAFSGCLSLTEFEVAAGSDTFTAVDGVLFFYSESMSRTYVQCYPAAKAGDSYTIPETVSFNGVARDVTAIATDAFDRVSQLKSVSIPDSVAWIGSCAFAYCTGLTEMDIPAGVQEIDNAAFYYCIKLRTITFHGNAPSFVGEPFSYDTLTAYYPGTDSSWTADKMQQYDAKSITWVPVTDIAGDVNGDGLVNLKDLLVLKQALAQGDVSKLNPTGANMDGEDGINLKDYLMLKQQLANG